MKTWDGPTQYPDKRGFVAQRAAYRAAMNSEVVTNLYKMLKENGNDWQGGDPSYDVLQALAAYEEGLVESELEIQERP